MPLLQCGDCRGKVSSKAAACPHCGCPVDESFSPWPPGEAPPPAVEAPRVQYGGLVEVEGLSFVPGEAEPFTGVQILRFSTGKTQKETHFTAGILHGSAREWTAEGTLVEETYYRQGRFHGSKKSWKASGQIMFESNFTDGIEDGVQRAWYKNGQLSFEINFSAGVKNGPARYFDLDGSLKNEVLFVNGRPALKPR